MVLVLYIECTKQVPSMKLNDVFAVYLSATSQKNGFDEKCTETNIKQIVNKFVLFSTHWSEYQWMRFRCFVPISSFDFTF